MKIQALTTAYTNPQFHSNAKQINQAKIASADNLMIRDTQNGVTYSPDTLHSKPYGERVYNYLDDIGYFDDMSEEYKSIYKQEIISNVYSFEVGDISQAVLSLSDSLGYLRNIATSISNSNNRQDFINFIKNYCKDEFAKINTYRSEIKQQELDNKTQSAWNQLQEIENEMMMLKEMAENSIEQCEVMEEEFDVLAKCFAIAMKIQNGNNVPQSDHQYLLENNPELYEMAITMREFKEDPEDCESVLENEDKEKVTELTTGFPSLETIVSETTTETE